MARSTKWMAPVLTVALAVPLAACDDEPVLLQTEPLIVSSEPPVARLDLDDDEWWVSPGVITGSAFDEEQAASTLPLSLSSSVDGLLWRGNPDGDGSFAWRGELSLGTHSLGLEVVDREGNVVVDAVRIQVRPNAPPTCRILEPRSGDHVVVGASVLFEAEGFDADGDPLLFLWRSSLDGPLFEGTRFERRLVHSGVHEISVEVSDGYAAPCVDDVTLIVD